MKTLLAQKINCRSSTLLSTQVSDTLYDDILKTCEPTFLNSSDDCKALLAKVQEPDMNG